MSFVLKQADTYKWPVSHDMPVDGGKHARYTFDAEFKRITQTRIREIDEQINQGEEFLGNLNTTLLKDIINSKQYRNQVDPDRGKDKAYKISCRINLPL